MSDVVMSDMFDLHICFPLQAIITNDYLFSIHEGALDAS